MNIFNVLTLLGGLAMFLYGMRLMGDGLKESSSGALKIVMEKVTNNPFRAFLLGVAVTAVIQSSTATIVITSGLVGAGILSLRQSIGVVVGANVGTTVTGQIIRLLDLDATATGWLQMFKPSTLAPVALIIGIVLIMFIHRQNSRTVGSIAIGFGILFSGLMNMTGAVSALSETGLFESLFANLGSNPVIGYLTGAGVAFLLQSSSATIGILQAFSSSGQLHFNAIYAVIVGIYLGDCVTTAIVCSIGAKADARRVGIVNILFNLSETVLVLAVVTILHRLGALNGLWNRVVSPGSVANTNTIFNLGCAILLLPLLPVYEKMSLKLVKDDPVSQSKYKDKLDALSPAFFDTPALALRSCYDLLMTVYYAAIDNIGRAFSLLSAFDETVWAALKEEELNIDQMTDALSSYLVSLSPHLSADNHIAILDQYYKLVSEFERLGDHAENLGEAAASMKKRGVSLTGAAKEELEILEDLIGEILACTEQAFRKRDVDAARHIEPLEQVVDELVRTMKDRHMARLRQGSCNVYSGAAYLNMLGDLERISDICSNVGISVVSRVSPDMKVNVHTYISALHSGEDPLFNEEYTAAYDKYYGRLNA